METFRTGTRLGGYRLIAELGRGGMASVCLAVSESPLGLKKLLVVKQICAQLAEDSEFTTMFLDEARLAARLRHPNVVQTHEVGEDEGRYFMAMEYLAGQTLGRVRNRLMRHGRLPLAMHVRVLVDVLAGLQYAHELADYDGTPLGVVHRDISPENVFVTYDGAVKIIDFGIAKARDTVTQTEAGAIKGKVCYMAPEQARGEKLDRRADVFAVGVMLWEAATGVRMWRGTPHSSVLQLLLVDEVPTPRLANPDVSDRIDAIIRKATAPRREARYATAAEFQADLEQHLAELGEHGNERDLGRLVSSAFEIERTQMSAVVRQEIHGAPERPSTAGPESVTIEATPSRPAEASSRPIPSTAFANSVATPPSRRAHARIGLSVSAVLGALLIAGLAARGTPIATAVASPHPSAAPATNLVAPESEAPAVVAVKLHVSASPREAQIFLDGEALGDNPFIGERALAQGEHRFRIQAPGYHTRIERMAPTAEYTADFVLEAVEPAAPAPATASGAPRQLAARPVNGAKPPRRLDADNPYTR